MLVTSYAAIDNAGACFPAHAILLVLFLFGFLLDGTHVRLGHLLELVGNEFLGRDNLIAESDNLVISFGSGSLHP